MSYLSRKTLEYLGEPIGSSSDILHGKFRKYYGGGKGDSPDPPDYAAQAQAQGQANLDAARATAKLNNPNIINPYGTQTVTYGGGAPVFNQTAYDRAMADYQKATTGAGGTNYQSWYNPATGKIEPKVSSSTAVAPNKNDFYLKNGDPDIATVTQWRNHVTNHLISRQLFLALRKHRFSDSAPSSNRLSVCSEFWYIVVNWKCHFIILNFSHKVKSPLLANLL